MAYSGDKKREYQNAWIIARRLSWIEQNGGECVKCGSTDRLEIDHIDRTTKVYQVASLWSRAQRVRDEELKKCQVLCHKCHQEKTSEENRIAVCGGMGMYNRGCRCEPCKEANRARVRAYRLRKYYSK